MGRRELEVEVEVEEDAAEARIPEPTGQTRGSKGGLEVPKQHEQTSWLTSTQRL